jgi:HNH endonuclease
MAISDKTRKVLWGSSGNRCAFCHHELVIVATLADSESIVGEECHIVSGKAEGPRYDPTSAVEHLDEADNLILLCRVHHKMVDDQVETFTVEKLKSLKATHESWVTSKLNTESKDFQPRVRRIKENIPAYLLRLRSGAEIFNIVSEACSFLFDHDELETEKEVELVASFLQEVQDWGELAGGLEAGERVRAKFRINSIANEVKEAGFWVFGAREIQRLEGGVGPPEPWSMAILTVRRSTNAEITRDPEKLRWIWNNRV